MGTPFASAELSRNLELGYRRMGLELDALDALNSALEDDLGHHLLGHFFVYGLGRVEVAVDIFVLIGDLFSPSTPLTETFVWST